MTKQCESCVLFNPNTNIFCVNSAFLYDGDECTAYIPCSLPHRMLKLLESAKKIADQICKEHKDCSVCEMRYSGVRHGCVSDSIETAIEKIKFNIEHEVNK